MGFWLCRIEHWNGYSCALQPLETDMDVIPRFRPSISLSWKRFDLLFNSSGMISKICLILSFSSVLAYLVISLRLRVWIAVGYRHLIKIAIVYKSVLRHQAYHLPKDNIETDASTFHGYNLLSQYADWSILLVLVDKVFIDMVRP